MPDKIKFTPRFDGGSTTRNGYSIIVVFWTLSLESLGKCFQHSDVLIMVVIFQVYTLFCPVGNYSFSSPGGFCDYAIGNRPHFARMERMFGGGGGGGVPLIPPCPLKRIVG